MKDKTVREFRECGRSGGGYTITMRSEPEFLVITNEWGEQTWIPSAEIAEVNADPGRSTWI
jgi:hypothetical protein